MNEAVILAGGFGTRLRPLTVNIPKPMVPILNKPVMERILFALRSAGISRVTVLLYHMPETIRQWFGDGAAFGINIRYVEAFEDFGTAGSVRNAMADCKEPFLVISGDVVTDLSLQRAIQFHMDNNADISLVLTKVKNPLQYGLVMTDESGRILRFLEKPGWGEVFTDTVNTGIYILNPNVLELIPERTEADFSKDLFPKAMQQGFGLYGVELEGYWKDIGNLYEYRDAHRDALHKKVALQGEDEFPFVDGTAVVHPTAQLIGSVHIGAYSSIEAHVIVENCSIGQRCTVSTGAIIRETVLWNDVSIGEHAEVQSSVLCHGVTVGDDASIAENNFIADNCTIGDRASLLSNLKLWPNRFVSAGATLTKSLVHEEKWMRELFSGSRIAGGTNSEMNPEFAAKIGASLGNVVGAGTTVVCSRDASDAARMIKRAFISGLMSVGVSTEDLQTTPMPMTRRFMQTGRWQAGLHVRLDPHFEGNLDITFLGEDGRDLGDGLCRKIERQFFGEDIRRVHPNRLGSIGYPERRLETYVTQFTEMLNTQAIIAAKPNVVIDYSYGLASSVFPRVLSQLQCNTVALNGYVDPERSTRVGLELERAQEKASAVVSSLHYDLGFIIDSAGERIALEDKHGKWFSSQRLLSLLAYMFLSCNEFEHVSIAVPVNASLEVEAVASQFGAEVVRVRNSHSAMMEAASSGRHVFVGGTQGGFVFPEYFFAVDGMFSIGKMLEFYSVLGKPIHELDELVPHTFLQHVSLECPWEKKGTIMRKAMKYAEDKPVELVDGVRVVHDNSFVLFLPDKEKPVFHVYADATEKEVAREIADESVNLVRTWIEESI